MMKKFSMLIASAMLFSASSTYLFADPIDIYPGMPDEELIEVLEAFGVPIDPPDSPSESTRPPEDEFSLADSPAGLPDYIELDNSDPINKPSMCGHKMTGARMANFPVSVNGGTPVMWKDISWLIPGAGVAIGSGWLLFERGDTWYKNWWLITIIPIKDIVIDPISKQGREKGVFDIYPVPEYTPGSKAGWPVEQIIPAPPPVLFTATYSKPVSIANVWHGDLYGTLTLDFGETGVLGLAGLPAFLAFLADTDCVLRVEGVTINSYQKGVVNFTLKGSPGEDAYVEEKCGTDSKPRPVAGPFTIGDEDGGIKKESASLTLNQGCYYSVVSVDPDDPDGTKKSVPLDGVPTNANNEYYHAE
jgi:hypothetical protein